MSDRFLRKSILALLVVAGTVTLQAQDTTYSLTVFAGGGYSRNVSKFDVPVDGLRRNVFGGTVRVMWKPEHLLRVGLETGITQVYYVQSKGVTTAFGPTSFESSLNAVPILTTFAMPLADQLEIFVGTGGFLLYSNTESFGNKVTASTLTIGFSAGLSYMRPLANDWGIGGEVKWYHFDKFSDDNIMLHVMISYRFLEW